MNNEPGDVNRRTLLATLAIGGGSVATMTGISSAYAKARRCEVNKLLTCSFPDDYPVRINPHINQVRAGITNHL